jgi:hypothetical protein
VRTTTWYGTDIPLPEIPDRLAWNTYETSDGGRIYQPVPVEDFERRETV